MTDDAEEDCGWRGFAGRSLALVLMAIPQPAQSHGVVANGAAGRERRRAGARVSLASSGWSAASDARVLKRSPTCWCRMLMRWRRASGRFCISSRATAIATAARGMEACSIALPGSMRRSAASASAKGCIRTSRRARARRAAQIRDGIEHGRVAARRSDQVSNSDSSEVIQGQ